MKDILGFEHYAITKSGRIWSKKRKDTWERPIRGKWLKAYNNGDGHLVVGLSKDGKRHKKWVHRLVLEAYRGKCPKGMECCHNNGNPADNRLSNLRWDTHKANGQDSVKHGTQKSPVLKGETNPQAILSEQDVRMIIYMYYAKLFQQKKIAKIYSVHPVTINDILHKRTWKHIWCNW